MGSSASASLKERLRLWPRALRYRYRLDPGEIRWVCQHLRPGDTAIDIGAHKGAYTWWMQRAVGGTLGRVVAFEPQPDLAAALRRLYGGPRWNHVTIESVGLSSESGCLDLQIPSDGPSPGATFVTGLLKGACRTVQVPVMTLDDYAVHHGLGRIALIKCDVEGHELAVFRGAGRILANDRPQLLFECERRHHPDGDIGAVFRHLENLGYAGAFFMNGRLQPLARFDPERDQIPGQWPYVNNFVFMPGD